jgi:hypothetical protein
MADRQDQKDQKHEDQKHEEPLAILCLGSFTEIIMPLDLAYTFMRRAHMFEQYSESWDSTISKSTPRVTPFGTTVQIKALTPETHALGRMLRKADEMREEQIKKEKREIAAQMTVKPGVWNAVYGAGGDTSPSNYPATSDNRYNTPSDYFTKESK